MKLIYKIVFIVVGLCISTSSFAQEYSDAEIGLDVESVTKKLQARGLDQLVINQQIAGMREAYKSTYAKIESDKKIYRKSILNGNGKSNISSKSVSDIPPSEKNALLALYNSTNGVNWTNTTNNLGRWNFANPVTSWNAATQEGWYGITVNASGRVETINLFDNNLDGYIPSEIGQLTALFELVLGGNLLKNNVQPIPASIGLLTNLRYLVLNSNRFVNSIPLEICQLNNLISLRLDNNQFSGSIPSQISQLTNLNSLNLSSNNLTGSIPSSIGTLINLNTLSLGYNPSLSGNIPISLRFLVNLRSLNLEYTDIDGNIPIELCELVNLEDLRLSLNQLSGNIPTQIGSLTKLKYLHLGNNQLSGSIPFEIGSLTDLITMVIGQCPLSGTIPSSIGNLLKLEALSIFRTNISGEIPQQISLLPKLVNIYLSENKLEGIIPPILGIQNQYISQQFSGAFVIDKNKFRFLDFINEFQSYKNYVQTDYFVFSPQAKINQAQAITKYQGQSVDLKMFPDGDTRYLTSDTYQWFKDGVAISGATNRIYTLSSLVLANGGVYTCKSYHTANPDMSPLVLEREAITLTVSNCAIFDGDLSFTGAPDGGEGSLEYTCGNRIARFTLDYEDQVYPSLSFEWTFLSPSGAILGTANGSYYTSFTFTTVGDNTVQLIVTQPNGCKTTFTEIIPVVICPNCTTSNPKSDAVKQKFIKLVNRLNSEMSIIDGYLCPELYALKPYISDPNAAIYNFTRTANGISFSFSNHGNADKDVVLTFANTNAVVSMNLPNYNSPATATTMELVLQNAPQSTGVNTVRHVNFCPEDLCVNHVAIVVDESGSLNYENKLRIRRQLRSFIEQQLAFSTSPGSNTNMYFSLIGMSDTDSDTRTDHVVFEKITASSASKFIKWIDGDGTATGKPYGERYTLDTAYPGVSEGSDFWKSGLDAAFRTSPDMVIMITDGSQTNDYVGLKGVMENFNNYEHPIISDPPYVLSNTKPHLFVLGIDNGSYVYGNQIANRQMASSNDPNFNPITIDASSESSRMTSALKLSLKDLLGLANPIFPTASTPIRFWYDDYIGFSDFKFIGDPVNKGFLSTNIARAFKDSGLDCGPKLALNRCDTCFSFQPEPSEGGKDNFYVLNAWAKEELNVQVQAYTSPKIKILFKDLSGDPIVSNNVNVEIDASTTGDIIEGWQRIWKKFAIPVGTAFVEFKLINNSPSVPVFFDDIRIYPVKGSMKSFVYDPETFRLMSELDENNYATYYEYDNEGGLVRIKKETAQGVKTIQETRSGTVIK